MSRAPKDPFQTKVFDGGLSGCKRLVLGIDQSFSGFSMTFMAATGDPDFRTYLFRSTGQGVSRTKSLMGHVQDLILKELQGGSLLTDAGMEAPVQRSQAALLSGELGFAVRYVLDGLFGDTKSGRPVQVPPTTLKKYATNKGNAKKNEVLLGVYRNFGVAFDDDNMADSYALARLVSGRWDHAYQKDAVDKMSSGYRDYS